jgi:hypothetical protein
MFYADEYKPDFGLPYPRFVQDPEELARMFPTDGELEEFYRSKTQIEKEAKGDPIALGYRLESWEDVMGNFPHYRNHVILGGNRSSKSSFAASLVIHAAMNIPEAKIRCWHVNEERSVMEQQSMIWNALPDRYKNMPKRRGTNHSISYTQRNGFTGGKLILPPVNGATKGSEILFANYQQYRNDPQVAEGWWAHLIWADEEMPQQLFDTLQYRLIDARGRMVLTFTTLNGWTPLVSDIMARVKTLRRRRSDLLNRDIPDAQESLARPSTRIYYFWTQDNPFVPADDFLLSLKGRPDEEILARAHGIPSKSSSSPFPGFDESIHVLPADKMPWKLVRRDGKGNLIPPPPVTRYMIIDPSGSKPWFIGWAAVDARGAVYIYREFPDEGMGQWAIPGKDAYGMPGPAQKGLGWGFEDYRDMILRVESENGEPEEIFERLIDPRLGAASVQSKEGATSIISELEKVGISTIAAPGLPVDHGIGLINDRLSYDSTMPVGPMNAPKLYISEACPNIIYAFKNYTNMGGKDEPTKDGIDIVRYLLESGADFVAKEKPGSGSGTFSY